MSDKFKSEEWTVVAFDMCSSSDIIEDLTLTGNLRHLTFVLNKVKDFVRERSTKHDMKPYKFMGDGWLLLFPPTVRGGDILQFATDLSRFFFQLSRARIEPHLDRKPSVRGLTFGIDCGHLARTVMLGRTEYLGRPLNVACRLQSAIKDRDKNPQYKMLVTRTFYQRHLDSLKPFGPWPTSRKLRNIRAGETFRCVKFDLDVPAKTKV